MTEEQKNLIVKQAINAPSLLGASDSIAGMEEIDAEDIRIPRIKLLQGASEEIKNPDEFPNLRVGLLINSISREELSSITEDKKKCYPFVPVKMFKSWVKFNPFSPDQEGFNPEIEPGKLIFKTYDKKDPLTKHVDAWRWKQINFLGFQPDNPTKPLFVTLGSMSRSTGDDIIQIVQLAARPLFEHLFYLGSKTETKNGNTFMVFTAKSQGKPSDDICAVGRKMYDEFNPLLQNMKQSKVQLHDEEAAPVVAAEW